MHRSLCGALALLVTVPATVVVASSATAAPATVSVSRIGGLVADDVHQRVFVADRDAGTIQAADYTGQRVDVVSGIDGVSDLALSADSSTLYAASASTHQVVALDPATLDEVARYTAATTTGPRHLAFAGGKVWFTYGDQFEGNLGSVDPASGTVTMNQFPGKDEDRSRLWGQALLDAAAATPDRLAVGETGLSTSGMAVLDVSGDTPVETAFHGGDYTLNDGIDDIDLVPGAPQVLVNGRERQAYADGTFRADGAYPRGTRADISTHGFVATADDTRVQVYRADSPRPLSTHSATVGDLVWSPDESRLFLLKGEGPYTLTTLDQPTVALPTLTVKAPSSAARGRTLTLTGTFASSDPFEVPPTLQVVRTDVEHPSGTPLRDVTVAADGTWSTKDAPPAGGSVTYTVSYAGDETHQPVTSTAKVAVSRATPTLTLRPKSSTYGQGAKVTFTAHLGSPYRNRTVELWADPAGKDAPRTLVRRGTVDRQGNLRAAVRLRRSTTVSVVFAGDARLAPRTVSVTAGARVGLRSRVDRQFRKAKVGGQTYYWFHQRTAPVFTTTMSPQRGRKARLDFQFYADGAWRSAGSEYFALDSRGRAAVEIAPPLEVGFKARVRTSYIRHGSGDALNATTVGGWTYLYWTR